MNRIGEILIRERAAVAEKRFSALVACRLSGHTEAAKRLEAQRFPFTDLDALSDAIVDCMEVHYMLAVKNTPALAVVNEYGALLDTIETQIYHTIETPPIRATG